MIRHSGTLGDEEQLAADVCIVGGGPAGLTLAAELLGSGLTVVLLESGGAHPPAGGQPYHAGRSVGLRYDLEASRVQGVGGSAQHWHIATPGGQTRVRLRELDELDMEARPGVRAPGWPFARASLEPYYKRARTLWGMQPAEPDEPFIESALRRFFSFAPPDVFTQTLPRSLAADPNTTMVVEAVATELISRGTGAGIEAVAARGSDGRRFTVRARTYVVAAGGIETPRLLLASRTGTPAGVGNHHDQVGRYFMEHPHYLSGFVAPRTHKLFYRTDAWDIFLKAGHPVQATYALDAEVLRREGLLSTAFILAWRPARAVLPVGRAGRVDQRGVGAVRRVAAMWHRRQADPGAARDEAAIVASVPAMAGYFVRQRHAVTADRAGRPHRAPIMFDLHAMAEQAPRPDSVVRLGHGVDRFGMPEVELDWRVGVDDADSMRRSHELMAPLLERHFNVRVSPLLPDRGVPRLGYGYHHMGTTRMSVRPDQGVVDADSRVHGVDNLFVTGSSVFPAGGSANPTLTIVALAMRLADRLKKEARPTSVRVPCP